MTPPAFLKTDLSATLRPGQLLARQVGLGRTTVITYHNGVVYAGGYAGSPFAGFEWSDWSDPRSFQMTMPEGTPIRIASTSGSHGHSSKMGDYVLPGVKRTSTPGVNIENADFEDDFPEATWGVFAPSSHISNSPNVARPSPFLNEDGTDMRVHGACWPWIAPFRWPQYGAANGKAWIYRADQLVGGMGWDLTGSGVIGTSLLVGNLLFVISDETFQGVAAWDLSPMFRSPAEPPILLDKLDGVIGGYLPAVWRNYLVIPTDGKLQLVDFSDPANLVYVGEVTVPAGTNNGGQDYVQFQDEFAFYLGSKVNLETRQVVLRLDATGNSRPAGSLTGPLNSTQYMMPVGNLLVTGGNAADNMDGVGLWVHETAPDTRRPTVAYHVPRPNQTNYPVGAAITLMIHESLEGYTIVPGETVILRKVGESTPVDCWMSFSHDDLLTITPKQFLDADSEYVVEVLDGGVKDVVGNGIEAYSFHFSTGTVSTGNLPPVVDAVGIQPAPASPGDLVSFTVAARDPDGAAALEYRVNFGDGTPATSWAATGGSYSHAYTKAGHFEFKVQIREAANPSAITTKVNTVTVAPAPTGPPPTKSSPILVDESRSHIWVVNPDSDSISKIHQSTKLPENEFDLRHLLGVDEVDPRSIALDGRGNLWVACHAADRVAVIDAATGLLIAQIDCGFGAAPVGVAATADGSSVFVTMEGRGHEAASLNGSSPGNGKIVRYATSSYAEGSPPTPTGSLELGPMPRAMAVFGNGRRVLVTRFISSAPGGGEVWDVDASSTNSLALTRTILLPVETSTVGTDDDFTSHSNGAGVPNYISSITLSPDHRWAWYTATKPDVGRGTLSGPLLDPDNTIRTMVGRIDLTPSTPSDADRSRIDFDNADSASAVAFSPRGDWGFVTSQGRDLVGVFDHLEILEQGTLSSRNTRMRWPTGAAPQGLVLDQAGTLWVQDFMGRTVTAIDIDGFLKRGEPAAAPVAIPTTTLERLPAEVLLGKTLFYNAGDERLSDEGYIACASCHIDGMHDGRTWDFTQRGEGIRNTIDLRGRSGTGHGNVHWTANFDEIHDFEGDIRLHFGGKGLMDDADFAASADPLGVAKAGRSADLDHLAAYVESLSAASLPRSPYRNFDGTLAAPTAAGAAVFTTQNCATCHDPESAFTDSKGGDGLGGMHDVGTTRASSGFRLGGSLGRKIDTPTLWGIWNGAPYLHNGSAPALDDVFRTAGGVELPAESATFVGAADIRDLTMANSVSGARGGAAVRLNALGEGVLWSAIDGGSGGMARLELRYATRTAFNVSVQVNGGTAGTHTLVKTQDSSNDAANWHVLVIETPLTPSTTNTFRITTAASGTVWVDELHVANADHLQAADVHTRVASLPEADRQALRLYLQQLDGRDAQGSLPPPVHPPVDDVTDYLVRWRFDDASEASGSNLSLSLQNDAFFDSALKVESTASLRLDGTGDHARILNVANDHPLKRSFTTRTISAWFRTDTIQSGRNQIIFEEGGSVNGIALRLSGASLEATAVAGSTPTSLTVKGVKVGTWHHATLVFDGTARQIRLHLDALPPATITGAASLPNHSSNPAIGGNDGGSAFGADTDTFSGHLDDVRVYSRALTTEEVGQVRGARLAGEQTGTTGYLAWASAHGLSGPALDPEASGGPDGVSYMLKYAFGVAPAAAFHAGQPILPAAGSDGSGVSIDMSHQQPDLVYEVQASADLITWSIAARAVGGAPLEAVPASGMEVVPDGDRLIVRPSAGSATPPHRFLRVRVALVP